MALTRAVLTWMILLATAVGNGALRQGAFAPRMDELGAHQLSCVTGITLFAVVIWLIAWRWPFRSREQALRIGMLWVGMTIAWELLFGHYVFGWPWATLFHDYELWTGRLWVLVLASLVILPVLVQARAGSGSSARR